MSIQKSPPQLPDEKEESLSSAGLLSPHSGPYQRTNVTSVESFSDDGLAHHGDPPKHGSFVRPGSFAKRGGSHSSLVKSGEHELDHTSSFRLQGRQKRSLVAVLSDRAPPPNSNLRRFSSSRRPSKAWQNPLAPMRQQFGHRDSVPSQELFDSGDHATADITQAEYNNFHRMFRTYDVDGSGTIDVTELAHILQGLGVSMTSEEVDALMMEVTQNDYIEFPEFVELMARHKERLMKDHIVSDDEREKYISMAMKVDHFLVDSPLRWALDIFMLLAVAYYAFFVALRIVAEVSPYFRIIEGLLHVIFYADILLNFRTIPGSFSMDSEINPMTITRAEVAKTYLTSSFIPDFLSAVPIDIILWDRGSTAGWVFRFLKLLKVFRIQSLFGSSGGMLIMTPRYITFMYAVVPIIRMLFWLALFIHWFCVIWLILRTDNDYQRGSYMVNPDSLNEKYLEAAYVVLYTVTTVGYGDIAISDNNQRLFACGLFVAGAVINGFVVSKMNKVLSRSDITNERRSKMVEMVNIMKFFRIPSQIQREILSFQHHILDHNLSSAYSEIVDALPRNMQDQLSLYVKLKLISAVPFFAQVHDECKVALAQSLVNTVAQPSEFIICAGEIGEEMYFLGHGVTEVLTPTGKHLALMRKGQFFGEMALVFARDGESKRTASVRALTYCDLFCLRKEGFLEILARFPKFRQVVDREAQTRMQKLKGNNNKAPSPVQAPRSSMPTSLTSGGSQFIQTSKSEEGGFTGSESQVSEESPRATHLGVVKNTSGDEIPTPRSLASTVKDCVQDDNPLSATVPSKLRVATSMASFVTDRLTVKKDEDIPTPVSHASSSILSQPPPLGALGEMRKTRLREGARRQTDESTTAERLERLESIVERQQSMMEARFGKLERMLQEISGSQPPSPKGVSPALAATKGRSRTSGDSLQ